VGDLRPSGADTKSGHILRKLMPPLPTLLNRVEVLVHERFGPAISRDYACSRQAEAQRRLVNDP